MVIKIKVSWVDSQQAESESGALCPPLQLVSRVTVAAFALENLNSKYLLLGEEIGHLT